MIWKIVKSAIGFKTMQLHLLFDIYLWNNLMRGELSGITGCPELPGLPLITKLQIKIYWQNLNIFFSIITGLISTKLRTEHPWVLGSTLFKWRVRPFANGRLSRNSENSLTKSKNLLQNHRANFNQTWHKTSLGELDSSSNGEPFNS